MRSAVTSANHQNSRPSKQDVGTVSVGGYATHFERQSSDDDDDQHNQRQHNTEYERHLSLDDDDDDVFPSRVRPVLFGRIRPDRFGSSPSTLLRSEYIDRVQRGHTTDDDVQSTDGRSREVCSKDVDPRVVGSPVNNDRQSRYLSLPDDDVNPASPLKTSRPRRGTFGGISQKYRDEYGCGPSTLLRSVRNDDDNKILTRHSSPAGDVQKSDGPGHGDSCMGDLVSYKSDEGQSHYLSPLDRNVDEAVPVNTSQLRLSPFSRISRRYHNAFGVGPSTMLTGHIASDDAETKSRGRDEKVAASLSNSRWGRLRSLRRRWASRRQAVMTLMTARR